MDKSGDGKISSGEVIEGFKQLQNEDLNLGSDSFQHIAENVSSAFAGDFRCKPKKGQFKCRCQSSLNGTEKVGIQRIKIKYFFIVCF